jgi:hypothetical protein
LEYSIPPYYENHFVLALNRRIPHDKCIEYQIFTIDKKYTTKDLNLLLTICRTIINEEHIQMLISDGPMGQLIVENLSQEYPKIRNGGKKFS